MTKINKEKARTYVLAVILSLLIVSVGITVAYFQAQITGNGLSNVTVNTENVTST